MTSVNAKIPEIFFNLFKVAMYLWSAVAVPEKKYLKIKMAPPTPAGGQKCLYEDKTGYVGSPNRLNSPNGPASLFNRLVRALASFAGLGW